MKKILLGILLVLAGLPAGAQRWQCAFSVKKTVQADSLALSGEGTLSFSAPDTLSVHFSDPEGDRGTVLGCLAGRYVKVAWINGADAVVEEQDSVKTVTLTARQPGEALFSRIVADYGEDGQPLRMAVERSEGVAYAVEFRY